MNVSQAILDLLEQHDDTVNLFLKEVQQRFHYDHDREFFGKSNGWICPKCGACFGPSICECLYCNDHMKFHFK